MSHPTDDITRWAEGRGGLRKPRWLSLPFVRPKRFPRRPFTIGAANCQVSPTNPYPTNQYPTNQNRLNQQRPGQHRPGGKGEIRQLGGTAIVLRRRRRVRT